MADNSFDFQKWFFGAYLDYLKGEGFPRPIADFAKKVGLPRSVTALLLTGKRYPSKKILERLKEQYGDEVYKFIQPKKRPPKKLAVEQFEIIMSELTPEERERIIARLSGQ